MGIKSDCVGDKSFSANEVVNTNYNVGISLGPLQKRNDMIFY